jgi:hypothetical protein
MSDLVNQDPPQVEANLGTSRKSLVVKNNPVVPGVTAVGPREGRITKEILGIMIFETDSVDVERAWVSPSKLVLHGGLLGVSLGHIVEPV